MRYRTLGPPTKRRKQTKGLGDSSGMNPHTSPWSRSPSPRKRGPCRCMALASTLHRGPRLQVPGSTWAALVLLVVGETGRSLSFLGCLERVDGGIRERNCLMNWQFCEKNLRVGGEFRPSKISKGRARESLEHHGKFGFGLGVRECDLNKRQFKGLSNPT